MAATGIKFDEGTGGFASNCFPVRGFNNRIDEASGAWLVAQKAEQRRRFKAVLCAKPRDFEAIREERKRAERDGTAIVPPPVYDIDDEEEEEEGDEDDQKVMDGFFLMKHCCVDDPSDLCSINISAQGFTDVKLEDLVLFDNVAYINAAENFLPFDCYKNFPILRELEAPLNAIRGIDMKIGDFTTLEMLDLSYNNLSGDDLLSLGLLPNLTVLHLTGNGLRSVPPDMGRPYDLDPDMIGSRKLIRYPKLEILLLDDNKLSELATFASLAALPSLRHLNLSSNEIYSVPQLLLVEGQHVDDPSRSTSHNKSRSRLSRMSSRSMKSRSKMSEKGEHGRIDSLMAQREFNQQERTTDKSDAARLAEDAINMALRSLENSKPSTPQVASVHQGQTPEKKREDRIVEETDQNNCNDSQHETEIKVSDLDDDFAELNLDELDAKVTETIQKEAIEEGLAPEVSSHAPLPPPPFPKLHYLNVAHNQIEDEEDLLAVAAWPHLAELVIHDNPLTTLHSGEPPLLRRFLHNRLGIHLQRKKPPPFTKPHIEIIQKRERIIKVHIPPVPKCNVDALLALEAPTSPPDSDVASTVAGVLNTQTPLPPIPQESPVETDEHERSGSAFFMTEMDEPRSASSRSAPTPPAGSAPRHKRRHKVKKEHADQPKDKFSGYEELLNLDDQADMEDVPQAADIQANVHALKYILQHPIMFRDNQVQLDKIQKPFEPHVKKMPPKSDVRKKSKAEQMAEVLQAITDRNPLEDVPLQDVLKSRRTTAYDRPRVKAEQAQAKKLLSNVQNRYSAVKETSAKVIVKVPSPKPETPPQPSKASKLSTIPSSGTTKSAS